MAYQSAAPMVKLVANNGTKSPGLSKAPDWPVVQQAKPTLIKPLNIKPKTSALRKAIILPDTQIGYRQLGKKLDPFHDEDAMAIALQIVEDVQPDKLVNLGDYLDLPAHSKYVMEPSFALTTQQAIDRGHEYLAQQRAAVPNSEIVLLLGNHDYRLTRHIINNSLASFGLRRANTDEWPVMTPQYLLRLNELNIKCYDGYPNEEYYINQNLKCVHGKEYGARSSLLADKIWKNDPTVSTIHGHTHHNYLEYRTVKFGRSSKNLVIGSPGCLCRIDGAVPSTNSGMHVDGSPSRAVINWQQAIFVVTYDDDNFSIENVVIDKTRAMYRDKLYTS